MFLKFNDVRVRDEKRELLKRCFNRCYAAVNVSHEYEVSLQAAACLNDNSVCQNLAIASTMLSSGKCRFISISVLSGGL